MTQASTVVEPRTVQRDLAVELAEFTTDLDIARLDSAVVGAVKTNILDTLACAIAGSSAHAMDQVVDLVRGWGGAPEADMLVFGGKYPAHHAAWVNSGMSHARDYDDTHDAAILHAGVSTVPAALAAGQLGGRLSGADLIAAVAAGLEVTCRLGVAIEIDIIEAGFIYSSLLGYFGATAAAGRALGLTAEEQHNAFGIVYSSVAGNHQVTRDASQMKRLQPGLAAQAAVVAVQLARRGIRGAQGVFDGEDGFFRVYMHNRVNRAAVTEGLGGRFELLNLSYKPYPCCRDTHSAIDATLEIQSKVSRRAEEIESIQVGVTAPGYQMVCVPEEVRLEPRTIVEAQFSIPYTVAAAWIDRGVRIGHFAEDSLDRADILALAVRVQPYVDEEIDRDWSRFVTPARVTIRFTDGTMEEARVDYPRGHPKNRMSAAEIAAKTADCATLAAKPLASDAAAQLTEAVGRLEQLGDIGALIEVVS